MIILWYAKMTWHYDLNFDGTILFCGVCEFVCVCVSVEKVDEYTDGYTYTNSRFCLLTNVGNKFH